MIYFQYIYHRSGLPQPANIALDIQDNLVFQEDVVDEFIYAFPSAQVRLFTPDMPVTDVCVRVSPSHPNMISLWRWGTKCVNSVRLGVGIFCVSERTLVVVPRSQFYLWFLRNILTKSAIEMIRLYGKAQDFIGKDV